MTIKHLNNNKLLNIMKNILYSVCEKLLVESHRGHPCMNFAN